MQGSRSHWGRGCKRILAYMATRLHVGRRRGGSSLWWNHSRWGHRSWRCGWRLTYLQISHHHSTRSIWSECQWSVVVVVVNISNSSSSSSSIHVLYMFCDGLDSGRWRWCIALNWKSITELRSVTCHIWSCNVTCSLTQVNALHLNPCQTGQYSINLPWRDGRLSWFGVYYASVMRHSTP